MSKKKGLLTGEPMRGYKRRDPGEFGRK